jgi:hypothetical protein
MPASRSVVSVLLRELGDFSSHPQAAPGPRTARWRWTPGLTEPKHPPAQRRSAYGSSILPSPRTKFATARARQFPRCLA